MCQQPYNDPDEVVFNAHLKVPSLTPLIVFFVLWVTLLVGAMVYNYTEQRAACREHCTHQGYMESRGHGTGRFCDCLFKAN